MDVCTEHMYREHTVSVNHRYNFFPPSIFYRHCSGVRKIDVNMDCTKRHMVVGYVMEVDLLCGFNLE